MNIEFYYYYIDIFLHISSFWQFFTKNYSLANSPESIQYRLVNSDIFLFEQSVWWNYRECYWMFFIYKHLRTLFVWEYDSCYNVLHFVFLWRVHLEYWAMIFSNIFSNYSSCLYSFILAAICFLKIFFLLQWSCLLLNILSFIELLYYN